MADTQVAPAVSRSSRSGAPGPVARKTHNGQYRTGTAYLFLAPFLILFLVFVVAPAIFGIWISLHVWNPLLANHRFVGLFNYIQLFTPGSLTFGDFWQAMGNTAVFTVAAVPLLVVIPLLLAMLLNQKLKGVNFFRAVFFAPYVLGVAVIGVVWRYLLDPQNGVLNGLLALVGLPSDTPWTVDVPAAWVTLVGVTVWWVAGFNIVIYLAGLKGINQELYEAAAIDGAGPMRQFWSVTIPGLRPVLAFVTTTTILSCANVFGQPYLLTGGGPGHATRSAIQYIANQGLEQNQMGSAAAMSYLLFLVLAIISVINFRLQSRTAGE